MSAAWPLARTRRTSSARSSRPATVRPQVITNARSGNGIDVLRYVIVHDTGKAINTRLVEGQMHGEGLAVELLRSYQVLDEQRDGTDPLRPRLHVQRLFPDNSEFPQQPDGARIGCDNQLDLGRRSN